MKYRLALFDFDGTLADSFPFFTQTFNQLAAQYGFKGIDRESVSAYRHHSARQMMEQVGLPAWKLPSVAKIFISLMAENASNIPLFDGVEDMLHHLAGNGMKLAIVSSNSQDNVSRILGPDNVRLIDYLECGMSIFGKSARIRKVLRQSGIPCGEAIYIGDQISDLEAAHREGVAFGAVAWGYGTFESLKERSPEEAFESMAAIRIIT